MVAKARCKPVPENRALNSNKRNTSKNAETIGLDRKKNVAITRNQKLKGKPAVFLQPCRLENANKLYSFEMESSDCVLSLSSLRSGTVRRCRLNTHQIVDKPALKHVTKKQTKNGIIADSRSDDFASFCATDSIILGVKSLSAGNAYDKTSTPMSAGHLPPQEKKPAEALIGFHCRSASSGAGRLKIMESLTSLDVSPVVALPLVNSTQQTNLKPVSSFSVDYLELKSPNVHMKKCNLPRCSFIDSVDDVYVGPQGANQCNNEKINASSLIGQKRITRRSSAINMKTFSPNKENSPSAVCCGASHQDSGIIVSSVSASNRKSNGCDLGAEQVSAGKPMKRVNRKVKKSDPEPLGKKTRATVKKSKAVSADQTGSETTSGSVMTGYCKIKPRTRISENQNNGTGGSDFDQDSGVKMYSFSNEELYEELQEININEHQLCREIKSTTHQHQHVNKASKTKNRAELKKPLVKISNANSSKSNEAHAVPDTKKGSKKMKTSPTVSYEWTEMFSDLEDIATNYELFIE